jgi:heme/copper-type cytochrome/quinol oxidase subunit 4
VSAPESPLSEPGDSEAPDNPQRPEDGRRPEEFFEKASRLGIGADDLVLEEVLSALVDLEAERQSVAPRRREGRRKTAEKSRFVLPARSAALGAVVVAIVCLISLIFVAEADGANALATIALALALLSFVIQIMVFIYQSQTSNQQMLQAEQLYTETRALLTEVRTAANSTETLVRDQFQDLLKAFMEAAPGSGEGEPFDSAAFERKLVETLRTEIRDPQVSSTASSPRPAATALSRARAHRDRRRREMIAELLRFPDEAEGKSALQALQSLSASGVKRLHELTNDELRLRRNELRSAQMVHKARVLDNGEQVFVARLSDEGRLAGRFLIATGEVPEFAVNSIPEIED